MIIVKNDLSIHRGHSIITFALRRGRGGEGVHKNAYVWEPKVGRCQGWYFFIKRLVHKLITIVTRIFVSFIKTPVLLKISVLKKLYLVSA